MVLELLGILYSPLASKAKTVSVGESSVTGDEDLHLQQPDLFRVIIFVTQHAHPPWVERSLHMAFCVGQYSFTKLLLGFWLDGT